jgi:hypothetical protein
MGKKCDWKLVQEDCLQYGFTKNEQKNRDHLKELNMDRIIYED